MPLDLKLRPRATREPGAHDVARDFAVELRVPAAERYAAQAVAGEGVQRGVPLPCIRGFLIRWVHPAHTVEPQLLEGRERGEEVKEVRDMSKAHICEAEAPDAGERGHEVCPAVRGAEPLCCREREVLQLCQASKKVVKQLRFLDVPVRCIRYWGQR